ncbi:MAG TPA: tetratricopeptide repeat protein [Ktedonobacteraceae bacterium]|nr:tetratricopeptide repeat protein [Ktedonobacteraceae bacterium]
MPDRLLISPEELANTAKPWPTLPVQLTSFVGREWEIARVCELLMSPDIRLLTLIGTGGVGKTRLGLQVATRLGRDFADGVCFISLMETNDPDMVLPTIAKILGLEDLGSQPILEHLKAFLRQKHLLLLLDNFEQVTDAAPALAKLLEACPGIKILATSRAVLYISGEHTFLVSPLELPDLARLPEQEELLHYPAITLFLERTRSILPDFSLNEENGRTIAAICVHLDGVPLAIELAVPRLRLLSPAMLLERLDHRFEVLTHGMRNMPGRHQTLQNTLEWSYRLLSPREQQLFRTLSVFVGGCTLDAIEKVWEFAGYLQEEESVLEGVSSLLDKSMLYRSNPMMVESRLCLLRTIREYGLQRLAFTGEVEQVQWAHATYYLEIAEETELKLKGPHPRPWLEFLEREHDNLREALCFLIDRAEREENRGSEMALRLGKALERFWIIGGHVKEGREFLERALRKKQGVSPALRGNALCIMSTLARYQGDFHRAIAACEESLTIFRELDDPSGIANSLYRLGYAVWMQGDPAAARKRYEESLAIAQGEQCRNARSEALYCFASLAFFQKDAPLARQLIEESLGLSRALNDQYNIASALSILGWVELIQKNVAAARNLQEESLLAHRELGNQRGTAHTLSALGEIDYIAGNFAQARERYEESLAIILRLDDRWILSVYLEGLARVAAGQDRSVWAVHLLSAADALRQIIGAATTTPLESNARKQALTTLQDLLGEQTFAVAWAEGQMMSPEQAIESPASSPQAVALSALQKSSGKNVFPSHALHDDLTQREKEVLRLVARGLPDVQVAEQLVISRRTVNFHLTSIYRKLEVSSRSAATRYALESHLF